MFPTELFEPLWEAGIGERVDGEVHSHRQVDPAREPLGMLGDGLLQDEGGEVGDDARSLGKRDELIGKHQAASGMLPANQGFDTDDDSAGKFDFRLVVDDELTAGDARSQLGGLSLSIGVERSPLCDVGKAHHGARNHTVDEKRCRGVSTGKRVPSLHQKTSSSTRHSKADMAANLILQEDARYNEPSSWW